MNQFDVKNLPDTVKVLSRRIDADWLPINKTCKPAEFKGRKRQHLALSDDRTHGKARNLGTH